MPYVDTPEVRDLRPEYFQTRLELAVEDLLDVATDVPILITVDDAQHMDKASRSLLVRLCIRGNQRPRVVVLCGRTSMGEQIDGSERIALSTLSLESIEAVAREHANRPLREFEIADIVQRSAGNPMFAALLAAQIASTAVDDLPESIEDLLAARIDHLPFRARTVLRELSVFGANINRNLAAEVLGDQVLAAIDGPERVVLDPFIAFDATNLRFRLPLVASTAYASLRMTRRRELHSAIAEVVPDSEQCSLHLMLAARYNDAVSEAAAAAERAVDTGAPATAVALFGRALTCLAKSSDSTPQQHLDLTQRQGTIALRCGLFSEALHAYTTARQLRRRLGNSDADILLELSMVCERQGNLPRARSLVRQCIAACAANSSNDIFASSVVRSRALVHLAGIHYRAGRHQACYETCASVLASDMPRSEQHTRGHAMYLMGTAASELAKTDAPTLLRDAIAVLEPTDDHWLLAYALNNLGVDLYFRGRWDEAVEMYDQSQRAATRSGDRIVLEPSAWNNIGEVRSDQGRLDEAAAAFDEALRLWSSGPYPLGVAHATLNIGRVAMRRGHFAKARLQILEASNLAQERGMRDLAVEARLRLVECAIGADDLDQAAQLLDAIVSARETANTTQMLLPLVGRLEGIVAARCGHLDRSLAAFQTSVDAATAGHLRFELALTLAARLEMHPHRASQAELQSDRSEAQRIFKDLGVVNV